MNKLFGIELIEKNGYKIPRIYFLKISHKLKWMKLNLSFYWKDVFAKYFKENDMQSKISNLKEGLDEISQEYINHFMKLFPRIGKIYLGNIWTKYDNKLNKECEKFKKTFKQPFEEILQINPYFYSNMYGLKDLPDEVLKNINGKIIADGGALNGDTALMFHHFFPDSTINAFEPLSINYNVIKTFLEKDNCNGKIVPVKKGLGIKEETIEIKFNDTEMAQITTLDNFYRESGPVGLIKLDTEGFESLIIKGGENIIKRDKPVIAAAIYHTPEDFFDLKAKLKELNPGYKFMIRRSEAVLPMADLVLIAY